MTDDPSLFDELNRRPCSRCGAIKPLETVKQGRNYYARLTTIGGNHTQVKVRKFEPTDYEWLFVVCETQPPT
jgi:hypothetical protein